MGLEYPSSRGKLGFQPSEPPPTADGSKIEAVKWTDADNVGRALAFDQALQLGAARQALRDKVDRYALPLHLLPERFTLTELQRSREAVLGHSLNKSASRRRLKASHDIVELADEFVRGARRAARLEARAAGHTSPSKRDEGGADPLPGGRRGRATAASFSLTCSA